MKNDLEFALNNSGFFEGPQPHEILIEAIRVYTELINAVMDHATRLSKGEIKPPRLFVPAIQESAPIPLKRVNPSVDPGTVTVPNVIGMAAHDATKLLHESGLTPKPNPWHIPNTIAEPRIVFNQFPE